jgi:hypothetical protein
MNGDGDPDLVVAIPGLPVVYLADGHGGFTKQTSAGAPPANIPVGLDSDLPTIGIADLTGDKRADVALLVGQDTGGYALLVYPGDGAGGLGSPATATTGAEPSELAVADFDGDGTNDLLVIDDSAQSVAGSVLPFVNDAGTLTAASSFGAAVSDLSVCDLNGDGRADFVWNSANGASVNAYIGQGHGAFVSEPLSFGGGGAVNVQQVLTADLNGDGKTDIVAVSGGDGDWSLQVSLRAE